MLFSDSYESAQKKCLISEKDPERVFESSSSNETPLGTQLDSQGRRTSSRRKQPSQYRRGDFAVSEGNHGSQSEVEHETEESENESVEKLKENADPVRKAKSALSLRKKSPILPTNTPVEMIRSSLVAPPLPSSLITRGTFFFFFFHIIC